MRGMQTFGYAWNGNIRVCVECECSGMGTFEYVWNGNIQVCVEWEYSGMCGMGTVGYVWNGKVRIYVKWNTEQHKQTKNVVSAVGKLFLFIVFFNPVNIIY